MEKARGRKKGRNVGVQKRKDSKICRREMMQENSREYKSCSRANTFRAVYGSNGRSGVTNNSADASSVERRERNGR